MKTMEHLYLTNCDVVLGGGVAGDSAVAVRDGIIEEIGGPRREGFREVDLDGAVAVYVDEARVAEHHKLYWQLVKDFIEAAPSSLNLITRINELILKEKYYEALKLAQKLIDLEQEVIGRVTKCSEVLPVG